MRNFDSFVNRYILAPRFRRWPRWVSHFLGYRTNPDQIPALHELLTLLWVLVSSFFGMVVIMLVFHYGHKFQQRHVPDIIPSWGATAILIFNAIESPLAQPRNVFFGTMVSSILGVCIMKLWMTSQDNEEYLWLSAALSVGVASVAMRWLGCVHPPAGAAALIPSVTKEVRELGWYYLLVQLLTSALIIVSACLVNNIQRRYPVYWWTPLSLEKNTVPDEEKATEKKTRDENGNRNEDEDEGQGSKEGQAGLARMPSNEMFVTVPEEQQEKDHNAKHIYLSAGRWYLPEGIQLSGSERDTLKSLSMQLMGLDQVEYD